VATVGGHSELGAAALLKAVWVLRLASLLTHLLFLNVLWIIRPQQNDCGKKAIGITLPVRILI